MKSRVFLLVLAAALVSAGTARAQLRAGTVEINPFAGGLFGGSLGRSCCFGDRPSSVFRTSVGDDVIYGARLGYNFTSLFEGELEYSRSDTSLQSNPDRGNAPSRQLGGLNIQYFMANSTFNFGHSRLVPYFSIGLGAANLFPRITGVRTPSDTRFTMGIGGGVKYFFDPHFGLRFDARFYSTDLGSSTSLCGPYVVCSQNFWLTNFTLTGGLTVAF